MHESGCPRRHSPGEREWFGVDLFNEPAEPRFQAALAYSDGCLHTTQALNALALVLEGYEDHEGAAILRDAALRMATHEAGRL